jgi:hypothetical protein
VKKGRALKIAQQSAKGHDDNLRDLELKVGDAQKEVEDETIAAHEEAARTGGRSAAEVEKELKKIQGSLKKAEEE